MALLTSEAGTGWESGGPSVSSSLGGEEGGVTNSSAET